MSDLLWLLAATPGVGAPVHECNAAFYLRRHDDTMPS
jgi:hypothetical protein